MCMGKSTSFRITDQKAAEKLFKKMGKPQDPVMINWNNSQFRLIFDNNPSIIKVESRKDSGTTVKKLTEYFSAHYKIALGKKHLQVLDLKT